MERAPHQSARGSRPRRGLGGMAEQTLPDFVLVDSLRPGLANLNLVLKVVEAKEVLNKKHPDGSSTTIVECVVGDASGTIILTARNRQAETCKPGCTITVRNGKIDMFKGTPRRHLALRTRLRRRPSRPRAPAERRGYRCGSVSARDHLRPQSRNDARDATHPRIRGFRRRRPA